MNGKPITPDGLLLAASVLRGLAHGLAMDLDNERAAAPIVAKLHADSDALSSVADMLRLAPPDVEGPF